MSRPSLLRSVAETVRIEVRTTEDAWNSRGGAQVPLAPRPLAGRSSGPTELGL